MDHAPTAETASAPRKRPPVQLSPKAIRRASPAEGGPMPALDGLTYSIHERHVGSMIGPSGLGKTTFLRRDLITEAPAGN